jgi:hypothetical protein
MTTGVLGLGDRSVVELEGVGEGAGMGGDGRAEEEAGKG